MSEEFNLSEKIRFWNKKAGKQILFYDEEDVKEFIRRVKERVEQRILINPHAALQNQRLKAIIEEIDKLAGDKLLEEKK